MNQATTILLGAAAGFAIFIGLPIARLHGLSSQIKGFLNAIANGVLVFLLWDVLSKAQEPVARALDELRRGQANSFAPLVALFVGGLATGLLSLVYVNRLIRLRPRSGPGAALSTAVPIGGASGRTLAMMIAVGLGLHNFSEGLAIGQSAATGALTFAFVLVIGFGLHNITEGFGIAAPLAGEPAAPSWPFLLLCGLIGGGPTLIGTAIGYSFTSTYIFVLFLTLAAGAILYIIGEMFHVGRRLCTPAAFAWGLFLGFALGYSADLFLTYLGG